MKNTMKIREMTLMSIAIALNIIGAFIALNLRLPIYMDSIGTILVATLLGPKKGVITGVCGSIISGMTFDPYSLYYAPVQISTGLLAGLAFNKGLLKGAKMIFGTLIFSIPTSIISAIITANVFGGITSSGSSYIVQILKIFSIPLEISILLTQIVTDYSDKLFAVILVTYIVKYIPNNIKLKLKIAS